MLHLVGSKQHSVNAMSSKVNITHLVGEAPPVFQAEWNGRPVTIKLDSSAVMQLEGNAPFQDQPIDWMVKAPVVSRAAERILQQQRNRAAASSILVSALDLDQR